MELYKQPKMKTAKKENIRLGGVDVVAKTGDEIFVLSIIKIYSYFLFVFSVVPKKDELLKILKEILKFSELGLISNHCNCLIGCILIARGYRP